MKIGIDGTRASDDERATHRAARERIVVTGALILETPANFGNGDADALTDMPLLEDELDRSPLLTGTSIAGALRNYLRERERGFGDSGSGDLEVALFGARSGDDGGWQSPLIAHDARGFTKEFELRDGVQIDLKTRTAADEKKFDYRLLAPGSRFELRFELLVGQAPDGDFAAHRRQLRQALATALDGLARGEITLGARKRRGFGRCRVDNWEVREYKLTEIAGLLAWLAEGRGDHWAEPAPAPPVRSASITEALGADVTVAAIDRRKQFTLTATFGLDGSLLVRSGCGEEDLGADVAHLHSFGEDQDRRRPVIPGTSWAGALRSRATQIINTLQADSESGRGLIEDIFGPAEIKSPRNNEIRQPARASRLLVTESVIEHGRSFKQSRVKLDRFTGGAFESALFEEGPIFGLPETCVKLHLSLRAPGAADESVPDSDRRKWHAEIGLLLLALKDLWTGDLALGGAVGVGRGRLAGREATFNWEGRDWRLESEDNGRLKITGDQVALQNFVNALQEVLSRA
ncbi:MAG TPA: RAMP superfamily CRISPR-associated protein [Blastocatellia bacterium]|nr:RAMP superfamily CRISPR-associated protein [Blastocatellia bacterium]